MDDDIANKCGQRIQELREEHEWTQDEVGQKIFCDRTVISKLEQGHFTKIAYKRLSALERLFGRPPGELVKIAEEDAELRREQEDTASGLQRYHPLIDAYEYLRCCGQPLVAFKLIDLDLDELTKLLKKAKAPHVKHEIQRSICKRLIVQILALTTTADRLVIDDRIRDRLVKVLQLRELLDPIKDEFYVTMANLLPAMIAMVKTEYVTAYELCNPFAYSSEYGNSVFQGILHSDHIVSASHISRAEYERAEVCADQAANNFWLPASPKAKIAMSKAEGALILGLNERSAEYAEEANTLYQLAYQLGEVHSYTHKQILRTDIKVALASGDYDEDVIYDKVVNAMVGIQQAGFVPLGKEIKSLVLTYAPLSKVHEYVLRLPY